MAIFGISEVPTDGVEFDTGDYAGGNNTGVGGQVPHTNTAPIYTPPPPATAAATGTTSQQQQQQPPGDLESGMGGGNTNAASSTILHGGTSLPAVDGATSPTNNTTADQQTNTNLPQSTNMDLLDGPPTPVDQGISELD